MANMKVACMAVVMCMMVVRTTQAPVRPICVQVKLTLGDCLDYLTDGVKDPSSLCCDGVKELSTRANTTAIRQKSMQSRQRYSYACFEF